MNELGLNRYKKYKEFDWNCQQWNTYRGNIFPVPPADKFERLRRKWYKRTIDATFDVEYDSEQERVHEER